MASRESTRSEIRRLRARIDELEAELGESEPFPYCPPYCDFTC